MSRTHDGTISAFDLDRIESELDAVTEQRDRLAEALQDFARERDEVMAERDGLERELATVAEQRDRLAEAASKLTHYIKKARAGDSPSIHYFIISSIDDAILKMDKALAAVKGGSDEISNS